MLHVDDGLRAHLETLVLEHSLDRRVFTAWRQLGVEDDAKGPIANDLALRVGEFSGLTSQAILDLLTDYFCKIVSKRRTCNERVMQLTAHS